MHVVQYMCVCLCVCVHYFTQKCGRDGVVLRANVGMCGKHNNNFPFSPLCSPSSHRIQYIFVRRIFCCPTQKNNNNNNDIMPQHPCASISKNRTRNIFKYAQFNDAMPRDIHKKHPLSYREIRMYTFLLVLWSI